MKLTEVKSSNVKRIGYDEPTKTLFVEFSGGVYGYKDVEKKVYEDLMAADSKGSFVAREIKGRYECYRTKLEEQA